MPFAAEMPNGRGMIIEKPFFYLRHGQTDYNRQGRYQGSLDIALNETGIAQAHSALSALQDCPATHIYCSPLQRARQTADIVNQSLNLPLIEIPDLRECNFGELEGKLADGVALSDAWRRGEQTPAGAETFDSFRRRVFTALNGILAQQTTPLIVAHGAVFWPIHETLNLGQQATLPNAEPVKVLPPSQTDPHWQMLPLNT